MGSLYFLASVGISDLECTEEWKLPLKPLEELAALSVLAYTLHSFSFS
jgi:hypothetical protein